MDLVYISLIVAAFAVIIGIYRRTASYLAIILSSVLMAVFTFPRVLDRLKECHLEGC